MRPAELCSDAAREPQHNNNHFSSNAPSGLNWPYLILPIEVYGERIIAENRARPNQRDARDRALHVRYGAESAMLVCALRGHSLGTPLEGIRVHYRMRQ